MPCHSGGVINILREGTATMMMFQFRPVVRSGD